MFDDILRIPENFFVGLRLRDQLKEEVFLVTGMEEEPEPCSFVEIVDKFCRVPAEREKASKALICQSRRTCIAGPVPESRSDDPMEQCPCVCFDHFDLRCLSRWLGLGLRLMVAS
jgi:hypothetical protein